MWEDLICFWERYWAYLDLRKWSSLVQRLWRIGNCNHWWFPCYRLYHELFPPCPWSLSVGCRNQGRFHRVEPRFHSSYMPSCTTRWVHQPPERLGLWRRITSYSSLWRNLSLVCGPWQLDLRKGYADARVIVIFVCFVTVFHCSKVLGNSMTSTGTNFHPIKMDLMEQYGEMKAEELELRIKKCRDYIAFFMNGD